MNFSFISKYFLFLNILLLNTCSQKRPAHLPTQGVNRELKQIYFILDKKQECEFPFSSRIPIEDIESKMNARVFVHRVDTQDKNLLREINSRNPQLIILGPGWPMTLWQELSLPSFPGRLVVGLARSGPWVTLKPDWSLISSFFIDACRFVNNKGLCGIRPEACRKNLIQKNSIKSEKILLSFDEDEIAADFVAKVAWNDLLRDLDSHNFQNQNTLTLNIKSGYLQFYTPNADLNDLNNPKSKFLRTWLLKHL